MIVELPENQRYAATFGGPSWQGVVVQEDWARGGLILRLGRPYSDGSTDLVVRLDSGGAVVQREVEPAIQPDPDTVLRIPVELARALTDALNRHFGGAGDPVTLRKDYDAERARVDRMLDAVLHPARQVAG